MRRGQRDSTASRLHLQIRGRSTWSSIQLQRLRLLLAHRGWSRRRRGAAALGAESTEFIHTSLSPSLAPSFLMVNRGSRAGPTPLWGKRRGVIKPLPRIYPTCTVAHTVGDVEFLCSRRRRGSSSRPGVHVITHPKSHRCEPNETCHKWKVTHGAPPVVRCGPTSTRTSD